MKFDYMDVIRGLIINNFVKPTGENPCSLPILRHANDKGNVALLRVIVGLELLTAKPPEL